MNKHMFFMRLLNSISKRFSLGVLCCMILFSLLSSCNDDGNEELPVIYASDVLSSVLQYPYIFEGQYITSVDYYSNSKGVSFEITEQQPEGALRVNPDSGAIEIANPTVFDPDLIDEITATIRVFNEEASDESVIRLELIETNRYWGTSHLHQNLVLDMAYRDDNFEESEIFEVSTVEYTFMLDKDESLKEINMRMGNWEGVDFVTEIFDPNGEVVLSLSSKEFSASSVAIFFIPVELKGNTEYTIRRTCETSEIVRPVHTIDGSKISFPLTVASVTYLSTNFYDEDKEVYLDQGIPQIYLGYE